MKLFIRYVRLLALCVLLMACVPAQLQPTTPKPQPTNAPTQTATTAPTFSPLPTPTQTQTFTRWTYAVVQTFPHDPLAFTQGLVFYNGALFESTGLNGQSSLREVNVQTGEVLRQRNVDAQYFAEGLALAGDQLIQLTWQNNVGFVYDRETFAPLRTFSYTHEGWGIAFDGNSLIVSDGTPVLRFYNPSTFTLTQEISVTDKGAPVFKLNELEFVRGEIWGNIWQTDLIARIDPHTGNVTGWIDLTNLLSQEDRTRQQADGKPADVLNGIAYEAATDRIFVTGKQWSKLFEIRLVPVN